MRIRPTKLDTYVIAEVAGPFIAGILFFSFVFLMFQVLRLADFFIIHGVSGWILLKMTALMILSFIPMALPVAFLIAVMVAFGRLSSDSELVAMKACGISIGRLAVPVTALSLVVVVLSLALNLEWVPWGDRLFKSTLIKVSNTKVVTSIKEGTFTSGFFDLLIYADKVHPKTNRLEGVFLYDEREPRNPVTVVAKEGEIVSLKTSTKLGSAAMLKLYNGNIHRNDPSGNSYQKINFGEYRLYLKIEEGSDTSVVKPRMLAYSTLLSEMRKSEGTNPNWNTEMRIELWRRYSIAISPLIFVFLGMGFGTIRTRAVRAGAVLAAFLVLLVYWGAQAGGTIAAQKGYVSPFLAMQMPNILTLLAAIKGFRSAAW